MRDPEIPLTWSQDIRGLTYCRPSMSTEHCPLGRQRREFDGYLQALLHPTALSLPFKRNQFSPVSSRITQASKGLDIQFYIAKCVLMAGRADSISENGAHSPALV